MNDFRQQSKVWFHSAKALPVPVAVASALPGLIAAVNCGGLCASAAHLLPILMRRETGSQS